MLSCSSFSKPDRVIDDLVEAGGDRNLVLPDGLPDTTVIYGAGIDEEFSPAYGPGADALFEGLPDPLVHSLAHPGNHVREVEALEHGLFIPVHVGSRRHVSAVVTAFPVVRKPCPSSLLQAGIQPE